MNSLTLLQGLFRGIAGRPAASRRFASKVVLQVEALETRAVPAASPFFAGPISSLRDTAAITAPQISTLTADVSPAHLGLISWDASPESIARTSAMVGVTAIGSDGTPGDASDVSTQEPSNAGSSPPDTPQSPAQDLTLLALTPSAEDNADPPAGTSEASITYPGFETTAGPRMESVSFAIDDEEAVPPGPPSSLGDSAARSFDGSALARYAPTVATALPQAGPAMSRFAFSHADVGESTVAVATEGSHRDAAPDTPLRAARPEASPANRTDTVASSDTQTPPTSELPPTAAWQAGLLTPASPPLALVAGSTMPGAEATAGAGANSLTIAASLLCSAGLAVSSAAVATLEWWRARLRRGKRADALLEIPNITGPRELM
jgi:hypothetical protein